MLQTLRFILSSFSHKRRAILEEFSDWIFFFSLGMGMVLVIGMIVGLSKFMHNRNEPGAQTARYYADSSQSHNSLPSYDAVVFSRAEAPQSDPFTDDKYLSIGSASSDSIEFRKEMDLLVPLTMFQTKIPAKDLYGNGSGRIFRERGKTKTTKDNLLKENVVSLQKK